jgi:hypothetical protein
MSILEAASWQTLGDQK